MFAELENYQSSVPLALVKFSEFIGNFEHFFYFSTYVCSFEKSKIEEKIKFQTKKM